MTQKTGKLLQFRLPENQGSKERISQELLREIQSQMYIRALCDVRIVELTTKALSLLESGSTIEPGPLYYHKNLGVQVATEDKKNII